MPGSEPGPDVRYDRTALSDLKIADFTQLMAGPYCTRLLADLGADVVKVESPVGDMIRTAAPVRDGRSSYWASLNVGKRSVVLDLKSTGGAEAGRALIDWADVVIENFRPGVMERLGLGYDAVRVDHPELVYCSISGYGQSGPWVDRPANAQVVQATSGFELANLSFQTDVDRPFNIGIFPADALGGALAFGAVLAGVHAARATGIGRHVDLSLLDGMLSLMTYEVQNVQFPAGYDRVGYTPYRTTDGWLMVAALSDLHSRRLMAVVGRPELADDPRFATTVERWRYSSEYREVVEDWTQTRTAADCEAALNQAGVAAAQYLTVGDVMGSEHVHTRGSLVAAADGSGEFLVANTPFQLQAPASAAGPAEVAAAPADANGPEAGPLQARDPGADTKSVLTELLGAQRAAELIAAGAGITADQAESPGGSC